MRAVFLDRDGVICHNRDDHVKGWDEFVFLPRAKKALAKLAQLDLPVIVITNQAIINRGMVPAATVEEIHRRMVQEVRAAGGRIDRVYYCPHRPDEGCGCRKPRPGLLLQAAAELGIDLKGSYLVGDAWTDIQAGLAVGAQPLMVLTGRGLRLLPQALRGGLGQFQVAWDLYQAVEMIRRAEGRRLQAQPRVRLPVRPWSWRGLQPRGAGAWSVSALLGRR
ncbi:MAG TPA: HAD family hydrolase [Chloroflexi bacterium]|nr:HAD family hydrolase [Chloroflexota bacterium]